MKSRTAWPLRLSCRGRAAQTSASPPVLAKGATSDATKRIFTGGEESITRKLHKCAEPRFNPAVSTPEQLLSRSKQFLLDEEPESEHTHPTSAWWKVIWL